MKTPHHLHILLLHSALLTTLLLSACAAGATSPSTPTPDSGANATATAEALKAKILPIKSDNIAHDPTIIREGDKYYLFSTGNNIPMSCSTDLINWKRCGQVFLARPGWVVKTIIGVMDLWAPDIKFMNGKFYLYYAASTFGSSHSAIGLATNKTLDQKSPDYKWVDEGMVLESAFKGNWNAIDPNVVQDTNGKLWLAYGSFWTGIKMRQLDPQTGKLLESEPQVIDIASRPEPPHAIEGAYILPKDGEYFLFVSFDQCCKGVASTYKMMVGRSKSITGPYVDRSGKKMLEGGGTLLLDGKTRWKGPGHNSILMDNNKYYLVYHSYDAQANGAAMLRIEELIWDAEGWPIAPSQTVGE